MTTIHRSRDPRCPKVAWKDRSGCRWNATLIRRPRECPEEHEIQVESGSGTPERVLCVGPVPERFSHLSPEELELVRRAARAQRGILWVDPRDGQLWWVHSELSHASGWQVLYSNARWTETVEIHPSRALTLLGSAEHQRLLDDARALRMRDGFAPA